MPLTLPGSTPYHPAYSLYTPENSLTAPLTLQHPLLRTQPAAGPTTTPTTTRPVPAIADAVISKLPRGEKGWKGAIEQWEKPDPQTGIALKDWPDEWCEGSMRVVNGAKYGQRRDIAMEYIR